MVLSESTMAVDEYAPWVATYGLNAPYGECQCGCGQKTKIGTQVRSCIGEIKGHPKRFIRGHNRLTFRPAAHCETGDSATRAILLTQGKISIVDAINYDWLSQYNWKVEKQNNGANYYAVRTVRISNGRHLTIRMHREIIGAKPHELVDHINGDSLDNRLGNLRIATRRQNAKNTGPRPNSSSQYKGVSWKAQMGKWVAQITNNYKKIHIGYFSNEEDAARAHDTVAKELHGEFARLNFQE